MSELNCAPYRDDLLWYAAGQLAEPQRSAVAKHLTTCAACRRELQRWQHVGATFHRITEQTPPDTDAASTLAQIRAHLPQPFSARASSLSGDIEMQFDDNVSLVAPPALAKSRHSRRWLAPVAALLLVTLGLTIFTLFHPLQSDHNLPVALPTLPAFAPLPAGPQLALDSHWIILATTVLSANDAWAVGDISPTTDPTSEYGVYALMLHYSGRQWHIVSSPDFSNAKLMSITMLSPQEGWAAGVSDLPGSAQQQGQAKLAGTPLLLHYLNGQWGKVAVPTTGGDLDDVQMYSATEGIATGHDQNIQQVLLHYHDGRWSRDIPMPPSNTENSSFQIVAPDTLWAWDDQTIWQYQNGQWTTTLSVDFQTQHEQMAGIWAAGSEDVWALVSNTITESLRHFDGTKWSNITLPQGALSPNEMPSWFVDKTDWIQVNAPSSNNLAALLHLENGTWKRLPSPINFFLSAHDVAVSESWAMGTTGSSQNVLQIFHYLDGKWSPLT